VPVREAFRLLETQSLAESLPRRGFRVTFFDMAELREVAEMRASLEALALRHAAPNLTPDILAKAHKANLQGDTAQDVHEWEAANRCFHRTILEPCQMPRLMRSIDDLQAASARFILRAWRTNWEARTDHDHRKILEALRKCQVDLACSTLSRHVGWIGKRSRTLKNQAGTDSSEFFR
jgi:DNA-binding GntR family transcriptional regulator